MPTILMCRAYSPRVSSLPWTFRAMRTAVAFPLCSICTKPVPLETCKTDEAGQAVHEDCYVLRLKQTLTAAPSGPVPR